MYNHTLFYTFHAGSLNCSKMLKVMFIDLQVENRELDEKLKQDDSESDQSEKSKVTSSSPTSVGGRRESSSSRNADGKETKKEESKIVIEEPRAEDIEEINYKEMLNRYIPT